MILQDRCIGGFKGLRETPRGWRIVNLGRVGDTGADKSEARSAGFTYLGKGVDFTHSVKRRSH